MKFLIDAQFPYSLKSFFIENGYDAIHTRDLPNKNLTSDNDIKFFAEQNDFIVVTKDNDFFESQLLFSSPKKLVLVKTGNCTTQELLQIFSSNILDIVERIEIENLIIITK